MTYYSDTKGELTRLGVQEGEPVIYTGTANPRQAGTLSPGANSKNAYVYLWRDGRPQELDARFQRDQAGFDILEVPSGEAEYVFLRDKPSGYIRQISGPATPVVIANLGAIPLRVDTFLGKFTVHAGTMLRLDASAPQREKKKVLLVAGSRGGRVLESAKLWDGLAVQRTRSVSFARWGEPVVYDLQKLRESPTRKAVSQCAAELPEWEAASGSEKRNHLRNSDKLRAFLEEEDEPELLLDMAETDAEDTWQGPQGQENGRSLPAPEPPEDFPE